MKIKWHGKAPWGFPPVKDQLFLEKREERKAEEAKKEKELGMSVGVCFMPGATLDLPKEWLAHWYKVPRVAAELRKGSFEGLEIVGRHDKVLNELYGNDDYASKAAENHIEKLKYEKIFIENRSRAVLPISPDEFLKSQKIAR